MDTTPSDSEPNLDIVPFYNNSMKKGGIAIFAAVVIGVCIGGLGFAGLSQNSSGLPSYGHDIDSAIKWLGHDWVTAMAWGGLVTGVGLLFYGIYKIYLDSKVEDIKFDIES